MSATVQYYRQTNCPGGRIEIEQFTIYCDDADAAAVTMRTLIPMVARGEVEAEQVLDSNQLPTDDEDDE